MGTVAIQSEDSLAQAPDSALLAQSPSTFAPMLPGGQSGLASKAGEVGKPTCSQPGNASGQLLNVSGMWRLLNVPQRPHQKRVRWVVLEMKVDPRRREGSEAAAS